MGSWGSSVLDGENESFVSAKGGARRDLLRALQSGDCSSDRVEPSVGCCRNGSNAHLWER